ncbi:hypothetical protein CC80DRAFT_541260 [Byssothecium circinans]|uniref:SRCR domain-containing protein n=1 Tax=Byssothecium circinans TaxID=147558 RepID=A0A6A5UHR3_9PLEO|nr:hypothetical protein CC80DRAFT_541260 [Byssothecium circinans]
MFFSLRFGVFLLSLMGMGATTALQLDQPHATPINRPFDANGWTPLPTSKPEPVLQLSKREADPALCGYLQGNSGTPLSHIQIQIQSYLFTEPLLILRKDQAVTCSKSSTCLRNASQSWFGCCKGTSMTDCQVYTRCVESRSVSACLARSDCANDKSAMVCTASASPFCATLYQTVSGTAHDHLICASKATSSEVIATAKGGSASSSSRISSSSRNSTGSATTRRGSGSSSTKKTSSTTSSGRGSNSTVALSTGIISMTVTALDTPRGGNEQTSAAGQPTNQSVVGAPSQTSSSAMAMRTAEAVVGVVGGIAGMLALMV